MPRMWLLLVCAAACDQGAPAPGPTPAPVPMPAPVPAPVPEAIELLHHVAGAEVRVSSQVANPRILPKHLIDGDMTTAWNSRTGELSGTWIEVGYHTVQIDELRLTVGHTGKGPRGEDYFTMNPRIAKVLVSVDGGRPTVVPLDPESRALQVVPVHGSQVRVTVAEVKLGTKRTWREVAVSELEAWGRMPATTPVVPDVKVGSDMYGDLCVHLDAIAAERERDRKRDTAGCGNTPMCYEDQVGDPVCHVTTLGDGALGRWPAPRMTCEVVDFNFGDSTCWVTLEDSGTNVLVVPPQRIAGPTALDTELSLVDGDLVVAYRGGEARDEHRTVSCHRQPLSCGLPR